MLPIQRMMKRTRKAARTGEDLRIQNRIPWSLPQQTKTANTFFFNSIKLKSVCQSKKHLLQALYVHQYAKGFFLNFCERSRAVAVASFLLFLTERIRQAVENSVEYKKI